MGQHMNAIDTSVMKCLILLCFFVSSGFAQKWANLKTTFGSPRDPNPIYFHGMPLTKDEAIKQGFAPSSGEGLDCNRYLGQAYGQPDEPSITLLFDVNGNLAGSQSILLKSAVKDNPDLAPGHFAYQEGSFFGEPCWTMTAYFMDPNLICTLPGRVADGTAETDFSLNKVMAMTTWKFHLREKALTRS